MRTITHHRPGRKGGADINLRPDVFAAVMATGIISISADDHRYRLISGALAVVGTAALAVLVAVVVAKLIVRRAFAFHHLEQPDSVLRLFTFVAACGVLAVRFEPYRLLFWVLGGAAVLTWLALSPIAAASVISQDLRQLREGARGAWLLPSVATSGLAIGLADISRSTRGLWWVAVAAWVLAVLVYCAVTWLIVSGAVPDQPDSWILMGGLAIATLAGNHVYRALAVSSPLRDDVKIATIAIWVLASAWIPVLVYVSLRGVTARVGSPRFAPAWWAMVFPLGMYSTATAATAIDARLAALWTVSLVFFWTALAAWLLVTVSGGGYPGPPRPAAST